MTSSELLRILRDRGQSLADAAAEEILAATATVPTELVDRHFRRVRNLPKYLRDFSPPQIAEHLRLLACVHADQPVACGVDSLTDPQAIRVVVAGLDMVGASACVTGCLAAMGLSLTDMDIVAHEGGAGEETLRPFVMALAAAPLRGPSDDELRRRLQSRLMAAYWHLARGQLDRALEQTEERDELVGQIIDGRFQLDRFLGQGGMGKVYLATQLDLSRPAVIKVLRPDRVRNSEMAVALGREARMLAHAHSHHVVRVYATGEHGDLHWLALEYMVGGDLDCWFRKQGVPSSELAARWLHDALSGLSYIHREVGLVHYDIKPNNLLLDAGQNVKIGDLGLSQLLREGTVADDGSIKGTLWFMSPEQAQGRPCDERSDLFSLGSSFYFLLSGSRPFDASTGAEILARVSRGEHVPLGQICAEAAPGLAAIIERMMQPNPLRRYQDAEVALWDLESYLNRQRISTADAALEPIIRVGVRPQASLPARDVEPQETL